MHIAPVVSCLVKVAELGALRTARTPNWTLREHAVLLGPSRQHVHNTGLVWMARCVTFMRLLCGGLV